MKYDPFFLVWMGENRQADLGVKQGVEGDPIVFDNDVDVAN